MQADPSLQPQLRAVDGQDLIAEVPRAARTDWFMRRMQALGERAFKLGLKEQPAPLVPRQGRGRDEAGFGMIDALVAVVIFGFGMAIMASLYVRMAPQPYQNSAVTQVQGAANALIATLTANPSALPVNVSGVRVASAMPSALQPWFSQAAASLPGFAATITSGPNATGAACSAASCGMTFVLSWTQLGITRQQTFHAQIGIS